MNDPGWLDPAALDAWIERLPEDDERNEDDRPEPWPEDYHWEPDTLEEKEGLK